MMYSFSGDYHHSPVDHFQRFSKGELFALRYLEKTSEALSAGDLSEALSMSSARVAALLRSLEQKGMIERRNDAQDRRKVIVTITDHGKSFIRKEWQYMLDRLEHVFRQMGPVDTAIFLELTAQFFSLMSTSLQSDHKSEQNICAEAPGRRPY
jgi:DNA-binding MarR family transcriptional regulator